MYQTHIDGEQQNIVSEPQVMYATSFNDMVKVADESGNPLTFI